MRLHIQLENENKGRDRKVFARGRSQLQDSTSCRRRLAAGSQSLKNILTGGEDIIMTQFIDHDKLKLLIKELYTINTFKENTINQILTDKTEYSN